MTDLLFTSNPQFDPNTMARVANLLLESAKFHAPEYAWQFGRFRAIGDLIVEATVSKTGSQAFKGQPVMIETKIALSLSVEFKPAGAFVTIMATTNQSVRTEFYSLGSFYLGDMAPVIAGDKFTIETLTDAVQLALTGLAEKTEVSAKALFNSLAAKS